MTIENPHGCEREDHCWLCSLPSAALEYHAMDASVFDRVRCANADESSVGVDLCPMCHQAVHRWMDSNGHQTGHPAADAVDALFSRFTKALLFGTDPKEGKQEP